MGWLTATFRVIACCLTASAFGAAGLSQLDALVESQRYGEALAQLSSMTLDREAQLDWLRAKGEEGHVPLLYELSRMLFAANPTESLKWYARGRLARTLDVAECGDASVSLGARGALDKVSEDVVRFAQANPKLFNAAIVEALEWDKHRTTIPPSKWICGESGPPSAEGYVLPSASRDKKRAEARVTMASKAKFELAREQARDAGRRANYRVLDSGAASYDERFSDVAIFWLDSQRVVFLGYDVGKLPEGSEKRFVNGVFVWDLSGNRVISLFLANRVSKLCVFNGLISLHADFADNTNAIFEGSIDDFLGHRARRKTYDSKKYPNRGRWPHCSGLPDGLEDGSRFVPLVPPHGYIDLRASISTGKERGYTLVRHRGEPGIPIVFPGLEPIGRMHVSYVESKSAYMVTGNYSGPDANADTSVARFPPLADRFFYWLYPAGRVEKIVQPFGACTYSGAGGQVTRRGYMRGYCLMAKGGEEFVLPESITRTAGGISIAPDGCRVAFGGASGGASGEEQRSGRGTRERGKVTLKLIDICVGR